MQTTHPIADRRSGVKSISDPKSTGDNNKKRTLPQVGGVIALDTQTYNPVKLKVKHLIVKNNGRVTIHIGSHYHFFDLSDNMEFDRDSAIGHHLNLPAATMISIAPGETREVELIPYSFPIDKLA